MSELLLTNIGMLATPTGSSARSGAEQGQIQILRNAWVRSPRWGRGRLPQ